MPRTAERQQYTNIRITHANYIDGANVLGKIGSEAFRLEYNPAIPEQALYNDIVSYLAEYRLQVQQYRYELLYSYGSNGELCLRDADQGEPMIKKGRKAIEDKMKLGLPYTIYDADLRGIEFLEYQLAGDGETIIYASPPNPDIGFTYGFLYVGQVEKINDKEKRLHMRAIRLDNEPTLIQYNTALSILTGKPVDFKTPTEFVATPFVVEHIPDVDIHHVLRNVFNFQLDTEKQKLHKDIIESMQSYIHAFIGLIKRAASSREIVPAFHALENYAIQLKEEFEKEKTKTSVRRENSFSYNTSYDKAYFADRRIPVPFGVFVKEHGHEPPKAGGSCGSSSSSKESSDIFGNKSLFGSLSKDFSLNSKSSLSESKSSSLSSDSMDCVTCPFCKETVDAIVTADKIECPKCHQTAAR